jgi:mitogen-activated protein kinase kinase kinase
MATAGTPPSPFIHQSFITISGHHNTRRPVASSQPNSQSQSQSRPATPGSVSTNTSTVTSITTTMSSMHSSSPSSSSPGSAILEPGPNQSYSDFVRTWQDSHIQRWLTDNRCGHHAQAFKENDIRGDIILELDMDTLKEIGIVSVGDRTRIKSAVAQLRKLCAGGGPMGVNGMGPRVVLNGTSADFRHPRTSGLKFQNDSNSSLQELGSISDTSSGVQPRINSRSRPPPLQIDNVREKDLPQIQRQDSARSAATPTPRAPQPPSNNIRVPPKGPIPPTPQASRSVPRLTVPPSNSTGSRSRTPTSESGHPPPFTKDPLPPAPLSTSPASPWATAPGERGLPRNPAPGNLAGGSFARTSPLPIGQGQSRVRAIQGQSPSHQRQLSSTSSGNSSRGPGSNTGGSSTHPYSSLNATLAPIAIVPQILSPVSESFSNTSGTPPHGYSVGRGPFGKGGQGNQNDVEVRRKLLKFHLGNSNSRILDVRELEDGTDLLERALRKFGVEIQDQQPEMDGSLSVGGWGIFLGPDPDGKPSTDPIKLFSR